ncbi:hypothetical protein [Salinibius halmophilus]|uniref:hypothetical protein n=1 Tax=Salinibius halmophilus TaxID=1853216 RepID=UPI000E6608F0|nr:hypothetical protein [Salinibius halmophilus]
MSKRLWTMAALASTIVLAACQPVSEEVTDDTPAAGGDAPGDASGDGTDSDAPIVIGGDGSGSEDPATATIGINDTPYLMGIDAVPQNPGSWHLTNVTSVITATVTTKNKTSVPDGTMVMFKASAGYIVGDDPAIDTISNGDAKDRFAICFTTGGQCSVTWYSGPEENMTDTYEGDVSVLAFTAGSNPFENTTKGDINNPLYDNGERFTSWGEPFNDLNNDGVVTSYEYRYKPPVYTNNKPIYATEYYYDVNQDQSPTSLFADYYGHHCADDAQSPGCGQDAWLSSNLRIIESSTLLVLTQLTPGLSSQDLAAGSEVEYTYSLGDVKGVGLDGTAIESHIPPAGTTVTAECDGDVEAEIANAVVPDVYQKSPHLFAITFKAKADAAVGESVSCNLSLESGDSTYRDDVVFNII